MTTKIHALIFLTILLAIKEIKEFTDAYLRIVRNQLPGVTQDLESSLFLSWSGSKCASSLVTQQFAKLWNRIQGNTEHVKINSNIIRKFTTTIIAEVNPGMFSFRKICPAKL